MSLRLGYKTDACLSYISAFLSLKQNERVSGHDQRLLRHIYVERVVEVSVTSTNRLTRFGQVEYWVCLEQPERQEPIPLKGMGLHKALLD
jgi:hypothetical protein